jgi:hypothetical protein
MVVEVRNAAALQHKMKRFERGDRKARTRTLIQVGELLFRTPLPSLCGIEQGGDLLPDYPDNAAILLGILTELTRQLPASFSSEELAKVKSIGDKIMKENDR